ncbi:MAG: DUF2807 domain-containing protein [Spirochaetales bacterium]|nr:DUF2807 domain-containing protein [Spirochaetales bacterium]
MGKLIAALVPAVLLLTGCFIYFEGITGSGEIITDSFYCDNFYAVEAGDAAEVNISYGSDYRVTVLSDDNLMPYVDIYNDGYTLHVRLVDGYSCLSGTFTTNITMPVLYSVKAVESSDIQISGFTLDRELNLHCTESSMMNVYLTDALTLNITADEASYVEVQSVYPVERLYLNSYCGSSVKLENMLCLYGEIHLSDASSVRINMATLVNEACGLIGQVSGCSVLYYRGPSVPGPILFTEASSLVYY